MRGMLLLQYIIPVILVVGMYLLFQRKIMFNEP